MLHLEKINKNNVWDIINLKVKKSQKEFVATNEESIIEAYTTITANGHVFPFGIYEKKIPVGFLMIAFGTDDYWESAPKIAKNNYNLWRFMIDRKWQNRGFGKEALKLALSFIKTYPSGKAEYCWLSYESDNEVAKHLYHSFGFKETGDMDDREVIAIMKL